MNSPLHQAILQLRGDSTVDRKTFDKFLKLSHNRYLTRDEGATDHCCVGCIIVSRRHKKIFLGHHKKSNSWLGVGGHVDKNEYPDQAVRRELQEEIQVQAPENLSFIGLTHFNIRKRKECTNHYDFFYLADFVTLIDFKYDTAEFTHAHWMSFDEALRKKLLAGYRRILNDIIRHISL